MVKTWEETSSPGQQPPKKTLAASIVESTKKQSIALVPKNISKLAQRFVPLFNPALFPHKPPPAAVANRVLFTDSEDEWVECFLQFLSSALSTLQTDSFIGALSSKVFFINLFDERKQHEVWVFELSTVSSFRFWWLIIFSNKVIEFERCKILFMDMMSGGEKSSKPGFVS